MAALPFHTQHKAHDACWKGVQNLTRSAYGWVSPGNARRFDFSEPASSKASPELFGVNPRRWYALDDHIHWVGRDPKTGHPLYDNYMEAPAFIKACGDLKHPSAQTLVKLRKVKSASDVETIFDFPSVWDLIVWVKPNPKGAFALKNPFVKP